jgi:hypothetical protein
LHLARIPHYGKVTRTLCGKAIIRVLPEGLFNISEATCIECKRRAATERANQSQKQTSGDVAAKVIGLLVVVGTVIIFLIATGH